MSIQKLGSRRTWGIGKGLAFQATFSTAELVSVSFAVSSIMVLARCCATTLRSNRAALPAAAAPARNPLRVKLLVFIASVSPLSVLLLFIRTNVVQPVA